MRNKTRQLNGPGDEWIPFAHVGRPHGLRGAFFLKTEDRRTAWDGYERLLLETPEGPKPLKILKAYVSGGALALQSDLLASREACEASYGRALFVHRDEIAAEENEYIVGDLLGAEVRDEAGTLRGTIVAVHNFGAQETLEIAVSGADRTVYFPFIEPFVVKVDPETRMVHISHATAFFEDETP